MPKGKQTETGEPKGERFWQFKNQVTGGSAELLIYGDIAQSSWWDDDVTPKQFADDLAELGDVSEITVRINSGGGDVFAAQAIGNQLEQHSARVEARIDGLCASAATIIACHCDKVVAANDSTYMIHPVRMGMYGYVDAIKMQEYLNALAAIRESIVSLYAKKTGRAKDEVATQMDATSWWTASQAKENGFVDELVDDGAETVVEDRDGLLFINSINMHMPFKEAPKFVQDSQAAAPAAGCFVNRTPAGKPEGQKKEETKMAETIKTADDLRREYPELVGSIEQAAAQQATEAERTRIQEIEDMALPGSEKITNEAKYTKPMSAADYAKAAVKQAKAQGNTWLANAAGDAADSGMNSVKNEPLNQGGTDDEFMAAIKGTGKGKDSGK